MDNHCVPTTTKTCFIVPPNYGINTINAASEFRHQAVDSSSASVTGVKPEAPLVMDWSIDEQYVLENCLEKLKDEPRISKYVKIAATLPDKTVRDVALRCRWMTQKRRKREENSSTKNISNGKVVATSPELNMLSNVPQQSALFVMNTMCHGTHMPLEGLSEAVLELLQQNAQSFSQISYNLSAYKDNISLFYQARNNINAILTDMNEMPGIMSRMPALPVSINDDLTSRLLPKITNFVVPISYTVPQNINLKQERRS